MRTFLRYAMILWAVTAICQAGAVPAADVHKPSAGGQTGAWADDPTPATDPAPYPPCGEPSCCEESCGSGGCDLGCDEYPRTGIVGFVGFDSFKGISDADWPSNFGAVTGVNAARPVPGLRDYGIAWQLGVSYGVYDFDGSASGPSPAKSQEQVFVTTGFFHKAEGDRRLSFGMVYDWMLNNDWGVYRTCPTMGQWRGQVKFALSGYNAFGAWGCVRDRSSMHLLAGTSGRIIDRPIGQVNFFWHHKFLSAADSWLWFGFPEQERITGGGSLGTWMAGANVQVPLSEQLALYANGSYFRPSAAASQTAAVESGYDIGIGIVWYFGRHAVSHSINGACWLPYMPVANNSTFLVDQAYR